MAEDLVVGSISRFRCGLCVGARQRLDSDGNDEKKCEREEDKREGRTFTDRVHG